MLPLNVPLAVWTILGATKTAASNRMITLSKYAAQIVARHLDTYVPPGKTALLYSLNREKNSPMDGRNFLRALRCACEKAGLPKGRFHDLRHSGLTLYGQAGATIAELMARAGHSNPEIVMIYQHATQERERTLVERM